MPSFVAINKKNGEVVTGRDAKNSIIPKKKNARAQIKEGPSSLKSFALIAFLSPTIAC